MPQRIKYTFPAPIQGLRRDIAIDKLAPDMLQESQNMVLRRGRFQPRYGVATFGNNTVGAKVIAAIDFGARIQISEDQISFTADRLVAMTTGGWRYYDSGTGLWADITGVSLSSSNHGTFRIFQKDGAFHIIGLNGGVDVPYRWSPTGGGFAGQAVGGTPPKAKCMMILANRLMLFNLTDNGAYSGVISPCGFDVSSFNDYESGWGTTLNGLLVDTPGNIIGALEMGDLQGAIYKSDAIVMAVAQAGTVPFHFEWRDFPEVGPCNERCIISISDGTHLFLGADGAVYRFDGVDTKSLGPHIQKAILNNADRDLSVLTSKAWGFYDRLRNEAIFYYKGTGVNVIYSVVINLDNLTVWPQSYGISTNDITAGGLFQIPGGTSNLQVTLFSHTTGAAYSEQANIMEDAGNDITVSWVTGVSDFDMPETWKTLTNTYHNFQANVDDPLYVSAGGTSTFTVTNAVLDDGGNYATGGGQSLAIGSGASAAKTLDFANTRSNTHHGLSFAGAIDKAFEYRGSTITARVRGER